MTHHWWLMIIKRWTHEKIKKSTNDDELLWICVGAHPVANRKDSQSDSPLMTHQWLIHLWVTSNFMRTKLDATLYDLPRSFVIGRARSRLLRHPHLRIYTHHVFSHVHNTPLPIFIISFRVTNTLDFYILKRLRWNQWCVGGQLAVTWLGSDDVTWLNFLHPVSSQSISNKF